MSSLLLIKAALLGTVEGLTEFLPVSSTGHLILAGSLLHFNDEKGKVFEIVIQFAAILAVCWEYRRKISQVITELPSQKSAQRFVANLLLAFLPAAVLGLLFAKKIKASLFAPLPVALAFIIGAFFILWIESRQNKTIIHRVDDMDWRTALKIGFCQSLALIPGTSRSGATIMGALFFGLSRQAATEFSFFLAIPTLFAATLYEVVKYHHLFHREDITLFAVGSLFSFIFAFVTVRALLRFVSGHRFTSFAIYRILFGVLILITAYQGWVDWSNG
ncbi:MAG: undecaprenyl-diphosphatase [Ferrovum sp. 37-45-19]|uniref:undecaprenyl-diphosphate phosphatase n=1 Tax=Ferrovum sp. JA12 TaxID=1356299 RepID=UPI0007028B88|nr:undecaprenyl-diphosphate phosphatase [Ferrovum sp. JA12]OYV79356.1 MAG: undecaprenyl-diphosphatase [Ferrovum sp. 21-44-67]OYV94005.1 MAG: undecaprenyl-diphosphatase [Ferrovum sp. 37-45-19]HQT81839.1 undecaprenyl-diphosphate phosphatase [Ferrovaceae bacterium]KRH79360.1 undecaprenyl-diphosphatase [Ferrovum sp. JA12]HQU06792.1 undecaprenyl-diphosphate phosphatase [Ferrovaceae bacterium]